MPASLKDFPQLAEYLGSRFRGNDGGEFTTPETATPAPSCEETGVNLVGAAGIEPATPPV